jgi:dimethylsulfoniopropionate demethylase
MSRRIRRTPYTGKVEAHGVRGFSVVNHMLLPKAFRPTVEEDYWHLRRHVQLWDVSCQRQVQIRGTDEAGGMVNDPVLLKLAEDRFWLSIADSDVLLWAKGLALGACLDVSVDEPDVSPLAIQGPKAEDLMATVFGEEIRAVGFFRFAEFDFRGTRQVIARSGYSKQGGFEIYLNDGSLGPELWDTLWDAGQSFDITPGCPNLIERIEGGLLSYGNEMTRKNNPLEIGLGRFCRLDGAIDFLGREALQRIAREGVQRLIRGVVFGGDECPAVGKPWPVMAGDIQVGQVTSGIYSPRLKANIGLSLIDHGYWEPGQGVTVLGDERSERLGRVSLLPFG